MIAEKTFFIDRVIPDLQDLAAKTRKHAKCSDKKRWFALPACAVILSALIVFWHVGFQDTTQAINQTQQELQQKMASAANKAMTSVVRKEDSIYRSDQAVEEQPIDVEADTWERRLERRAQERDLEERGWAPAPKRSAAKSKSRIDK